MSILRCGNCAFPNQINRRDVEHFTDLLEACKRGTCIASHMNKGDSIALDLSIWQMKTQALIDKVEDT